MAKVKCFEIEGLFCWFWPMDHEPPHFHAKRKGEWEIRVKFTEQGAAMFEVKWGVPPKSKVLKALANAVRMHRMALLEEWEKNVNP